MADKKVEKLGGIWPIAVLWLLTLAGLVCYWTATLLALNNVDFALIPGLTAIHYSIITQLLGTIALIWTILWVLDAYRKSYGFFQAVLEQVRTLRAGQTQTEAILTQISENILLSDAVKAIAFREKDRSVLEDAIHHDIRQEKWESAEKLLEDLEKRFGSVKESRQLRAEMDRYRKASIQDKIDGAIRHIESLWLIHHYNEAGKEVDALLRLYPDNIKVKNLSGQTEKHRAEHKKSLLARWEEARQNNRVDEAVEILQLLDTYLTPAEAAKLEEPAREIFRMKLQKLGDAFRKQVTDKNWEQAVRIGQEIVQGFPNSRMAQEVREKMEVLQQRAQETQQKQA